MLDKTQARALFLSLQYEPYSSTTMYQLCRDTISSLYEIPFNIQIELCSLKNSLLEFYSSRLRNQPCSDRIKQTHKDSIDVLKTSLDKLSSTNNADSISIMPVIIHARDPGHVVSYFLIKHKERLYCLSNDSQGWNICSKNAHDAKNVWYKYKDPMYNTLKKYISEGNFLDIAQRTQLAIDDKNCGVTAMKSIKIILDFILQNRKNFLLLSQDKHQLIRLITDQLQNYFNIPQSFEEQNLVRHFQILNKIISSDKSNLQKEIEYNTKHEDHSILETDQEQDVVYF